jgi:hypothetical protein
MSRDTGDGTETERLEWRKTPAAVVDFKTAIGRERDYEAVFLWEDHEAVDWLHVSKTDAILEKGYMFPSNLPL